MPTVEIDHAIQHLQAGRVAAAEGVLRQILSQQPDHGDALHLMGVLSGQAGRPDEAEDFFRRAIAAQPLRAHSILNLSLALEQQGKLQEAVQTCRMAVSLLPTEASAHNQLGVFLRKTGAVGQAIASHRRAIELKPDFAWAHHNLGNALQERRCFDEAISCYERAILLAGENCKFLCGLASAYKESGNLDRALDCYRRALALRADDFDAVAGIAGVYQETGQIDLAIEHFRQAIQLNPASVSTHDRLLFALLHDPKSTFESTAAEQLRWKQLHSKPSTAPIQPVPTDRDPDRKLRIGLVSADFRGHAVGLFLTPLFKSIDRTRFELFCYWQGFEPDPQTAWFESHADGWRMIFGRSDDEVAAIIRADAIDILIDLSMHTAGNRLMVFARRPAPAQVSYLAYAGGPALSAIDYRLTDRHLDPDESKDRLSPKKSIHLTGTYWCYPARPDPIPPGNLPAAENGFVTFGCLNKFSKISEAALEIWARLIADVAASKLMLHAPPGNHRQRTLDCLSARGIDPQRVEFVPQLSTTDYLAMYQRIDIALDPFPFAGATTTCDALWMGVPVVTLAGRTAIERAGVSILNNAGFPDWIATSTAEYIAIAANLAGDLPKLARLRSTMREQLKQSPLMDATGYARSIESALRTMWSASCDP
jgi:predicted O-linked N-acetylglucosamine transferase (SPINDLY family)